MRGGLVNNGDTSLAWRYHDLTKHSYSSIRTTPHFLDWSNMPFPFKVYPDLEPIPLTGQLRDAGVPALRAISSRNIAGRAGGAIGLVDLAGLLYYSSGITKEKPYPSGTIYFRAAACAGALYPVEVYVVCSRIDDLAAGVYHFSPRDFALRRLRAGDFRGALLDATAGQPDVAYAPVVLIYTAISWRSSWKYRERSYRYHFWDSGTVLANATAMAVALGIPAALVIGFVDGEVGHLVGIDGRRELPLCLLALGSAPAVEDIPAPIPPDQVSDIDPNVVPLSHSQVDYPAIYEMHQASSLQVPDDVAAWRAGLSERPSPLQLSPDPSRMRPLAPIQEDRLPDESIGKVIMRRASSRRFARKPISFERLSTILERSTSPVAADFLPGPANRANHMYMIVNRVEGIGPGSYYYDEQNRALELLRDGDFSREASYLVLEQELGGDASVTIFFMADLAALLERAGNRGYRIAQFEAGVLGGRVYLAAYALGLGASGLTFYDDDVTNFFSPHAAGKSCMLVTAVGVAGKRPLL